MRDGAECWEQATKCGLQIFGRFTRKRQTYLMFLLILLREAGRGATGGGGVLPSELELNRRGFKSLETCSVFLEKNRQGRTQIR
jgi:hypothetical protein